MTDGFIVDKRCGFTYRIVKQERGIPQEGLAWSGEVRVGGQSAIKGALRLQVAECEDDGVIYLDRDKVVALMKAIALTLGEIKRGEGIQG